MHKRTYTLLVSVLFALLLTGAGMAISPTSTRVWAEKPQDALAAAWSRAREAGSYRFLSTADQMLIPRPIPQMIGERDIQLTLENDGAVVLPDQSYVAMRIASMGRSRSATLLYDGGKAYLLQDGALSAVDNALDLASPTTDVLSYLSAAEGVTLLDPPEGHAELTRYGFQVNGEKFEAYVREQAERSLAAEPGAPGEIKLQTLPALQAISGQGELWVNRAGLPVRQVVELTMPEVNEAYSARVRMVVDLSGYGQVSALPHAVQGADGSWQMEGTLDAGSTTSLDPFGGFQARASAVTLPPTVLDGWRALFASALPLRIPPTTMALFVMLVLAILLVTYYRRNPRRCYALIICFLLPLMVFSSLLQVGQLVRFQERQVQAAAERATAAPRLLQALGLATEAEAPEVQADAAPAAAPRRAVASTIPARVSSPPAALQGGEEQPDCTRCGCGQPGVDTDGDGLTDQVELCLGTSADEPDSDQDRIPDGIEATGFDLGGKHWTSDPLQPDSNGDRIPDTLEWSADLAPQGQAASMDLDSDGIPNLWDDDDDGDGVPDGGDLSPFAVSGALDELSLSTAQSPGAAPAYETVEIQVRPVNPAHLRYSTTTLDWPDDSQGNVRDLDASTADLRLMPFLLVTTNVTPTQVLRDKYGVAAWGGEDGTYSLLVPLVPVENGGAIDALYGKVVYAPEQTGDIQWQGEMIWAAVMQQDTLNGENATVETVSSWLHQYKDEFRLTGLKIGKDQGYEAAVFGTPGRVDDIDLFRLLLGLGQVYTGYFAVEGQAEDETALEEIAQRFASGSNEPSYQTFGVAPSSVALVGPSRYACQDEGLAALGAEVVPAYLETYDQYYGTGRCQDAEGHAVDCAALVLAYEQWMGTYDLANLRPAGAADLVTVDASNLHISLADVQVVDTRGVQFRMYEQGAGGWQVTTADHMLEFVEQRYDDDYATALRDLYPNLTVEALRFIAYTAYLWAMTPFYRAVAVDGELLVPPLPDEAQLALTRMLPPDLEEQANSALTWCALTFEIADALGGVAYIFWDISDWTDLPATLKSATEKLYTKGLDSVAVVFFGASIIATGIMAIWGAVCEAAPEQAGCANPEAFKIAQVAVDVLSMVAQFLWILQIINKLKGPDLLNGISKGVIIAGTIISVAVVWIMFGLNVGLGNPDPAALRMLIAEALVTTIWLVALLLLNLLNFVVPGLGTLISNILSLIDQFISWFFGLFGIDMSIVGFLVGLLYEAHVTTALSSAEFGEFDSELVEPDHGLVGGNTLRLNLPFSGTIESVYAAKEGGSFQPTDEGVIYVPPPADPHYYEDPANDLRLSSVRGVLTPTGALNDTFAVQDLNQTSPDCQVIPGTAEYITYTLHCSNTAALGYVLAPQVNGLLSFAAKVLYTTVWAEYAFFGTVRYNTHRESGELPEEIEPVTLDLDVLPATIDELWHWDALGNPDRDGDGLENEAEGVLGTDPDDWDTDGDRLSDGYEWEDEFGYGIDPLLADTDNDGLDDGRERRAGTLANVADSDGDGLSDGVEVRHVDQGAPAGGRAAIQAAGDTYAVQSNPFLADSDGDGLNDAEELANGLSPQGKNALVPDLSLRAAPVRGLAGGRAGAYWTPGETVTFSIDLGNWATGPVVTPLRLTLPAWLESIAGGISVGDRALTPTLEGHTLTWSFSETDPLQVYEAISMVVTARVKSDTTSANEEIVLDLLYGDVQMRKTVAAVVDGDDPRVAIIAPPDGAYLRGTSYVLGGSTTDPTTWITARGLRIVPQGEAGDWMALPVAQGPWAYTWALPTDGHYTLQVQATDAMAHQATTGPVNVTVDNTAPVATLSSEMVDGTVHLSGTATDNLSGVRWVQVGLDGQPWRTAPLNDAAWSYDWAVGAGGQGKHTANVRALDRAGNASVVLSVEIVVDRVAPSSIVNAGADLDAPPAVRPNMTFALGGVADEGGHLPLPAVPAALREGMDVFDDGAVWLGLSTIHDNDGGLLAAWIGDFNGDRLSDLAVGLPGPQGAAGMVSVLYGRAGGWPVPPDLEMLAASPMRFSGVEGARLGSLLAAAGDVNGDRLADLLIGERASARATLVLGTSRPLGGVTLEGGRAGFRTELVAPATITGLASAGDVDGDNRDDLLVLAGGTAYLLPGRTDPWPATLDVAAEAAQTVSGVTGALGVGDVDHDQLAEWATLADGLITLKGVDPAKTYPTADAESRAVALGDVNGDGTPDWLYTSGSQRILVYGAGATHTFTGYDGFCAAPGDVDGDGRADLLLTDAAGLATLIHQPQGQEAPQAFATIQGVGGAANAPYAAGADLNADGSADLLLIPSEAAAEARGFDAPDFSAGFISPQSLPLGASSANAEDGALGEAFHAGLAGILSSGPDNRYVDDDGICDGLTPCYATIQAAVNACDGGGDAITVYPGVYAAFSVPAGASYDNLSIVGVSADAVFVDGAAGASAISVAADGVRLSTLTVRNGTAGVLLQAGAGVPAAAGGPPTSIDHLVAHSVRNAINIDQSAALDLSDSTLVGNGTHSIIQTGAEDSTAHAWYQDRALSGPLSTNGGLASTASTLYAMPGGADRTVYAATPGADGALGAWSAAFTVPEPLPEDAGQSAIAAGGNHFFQIRALSKGPDLGAANGEVQAVAVAANGDVYVGGTFTQIGGVSNLQHIARWDGTQWRPLGQAGAASNGVNGPVHALTILSNGDLYVGGEFSLAYNGTGQSVAVANVVRWSGGQWFGVGGGLDGPVFALAHTDDDYVLIGGSFAFQWPDTFTYTYNWMIWAPGQFWFAPAGTWEHDTGLWVSGGGGQVRSIAWSGGNLTDGTAIVGGSFANADIYEVWNIVRFHYDPVDSHHWAVYQSPGIPTTVADVAIDLTTGGTIYAVSDDVASPGVYRSSDPLMSSWSVPSGASGPGGALYADAGGNVYAGMANGNVYLLAAGDASLRLIGSETMAVRDLALDGAGSLLVARGSFDGGLRRYPAANLYRRNLSAGTWETLSYPPQMDRLAAPLIAADDAGTLYAGWTDLSDGLQRVRLYSLAAGATTWAERASTSAGVAVRLRKLAWTGQALYALTGYSYYAPAYTEVMFGVAWTYDPATDQWTDLGNLDSRAIDSSASVDLVSLTTDTLGRPCTLSPSAPPFWRHDREYGGWFAMTTPTGFPTSQPTAMAHVGGYLYVYATPNSGFTTNLFRYGRVGLELRVQAHRNVFVLPDTAGNVMWRSPDSYRLLMQTPADNQWVGRSGQSWYPYLPEAALTTAQAAFVAPVDGLYRLGAGSLVTVGYHHYVAVAHVYPSQAACALCGSGGITWGVNAFATLREAVESGAARVLVHPGRYPQSFYLVSGVEVLGAGAESTIIEPPAGTAATLVTAEGVAHASLARLTLAGGSAWNGFLAEGGATGLTLSRLILRDLSTGVRLRGNAAVEIVNNTLVRNASGIVAEGATPVNVRNTILAYSGGTALTYGAPSSLANTYNDFWANADDQNPNADPGLGSQFVDPRFRNLADNDLRLAASSKLIDMGAPNDPTTPGGGARVDIGYAEYGGANFYVSREYSETGLNDGLTWGVDAFNQIQPALNAAANTMAGLRGALPMGGYSVAVDAGTYEERVTVPSHVRLVGSGPEVTTIDAGNGGNAVTFNGVIDAELSGFYVRNASAGSAGVAVGGAASAISLYRNVIGHNAGRGVSFAGQASGVVSFNTIVDNTGAGVYASGAGAWALVSNNLLAGNGFGLQVESGGLLPNSFNLLHNTTNLSGVSAGFGTVTGDPAFMAGSVYVPSAGSPAIDAADPRSDAPLAGGLCADLGYKELIACPLTVVLGPQVAATVVGNSGVALVEWAVVPVSDPTQPVTATLPSGWSTITGNGQATFAWSQSQSQAAPGLYRVYTRATDAAGNAESEESDWYEGAFVVDDTAPTVSWGAPALPSSTSAAAVLAVAQAVGTVSTSAGTRDDVARFYFAVSGPGGALTYPVVDGRAWIPLPAAGSYTIEAVAVDEAGNQASQSATVAVSAPGSVATVTEPAGSAVSSAMLTLRGMVRFATSGTVSVAVSGGSTVQATLDAPGASFSAWSAAITLPAGDGNKTVTVTPTGGTATVLNLILDTTAPTLSVTAPAAGATAIETVALAGTAADAGSGLARVEVSLDGGYTWRPATLAGGAWSLEWTPGVSRDRVSYPARVRATDAAGKRAVVSWPVALDNEPPVGLAPLSFTPQEGQHVDLGTSLALAWHAPVDAGGPVAVLWAVDQAADTVPTTVAGGTSATAALNATGKWYVHLLARDAAGNETLIHRGPWHVRDLANPAFGARRHSIILDGRLDLDHDEWRAAELLGIDARSGHPQALYASWDGQYIFLGWSGAWWTLDGVLWAYLSTAAGGTTTGVDGGTLPNGLAADRAVQITGPAEGALWTWNGSVWVEGALDFVNGPDGDTEARVPFTAPSGELLQLLAFALPREAEGAIGGQMRVMAGDVRVQEDTIAPWAMLPATNALATSPTQYYEWTNVPTVTDINDGQPLARTVFLDVSSPQATGTAWCPEQDIVYDILLRNPEPALISGLTLTLAATSGLGYWGVSGATRTSGSDGGANWTLNVPALAAGASTHVTVTAKTASVVTGLTQVTSNISLAAGTIVLTPESDTAAVVTHRVDGAAPVVTFDVLGGSAIRSGQHTFTGSARDDGCGVGGVKVSIDGGKTWQVALGTTTWAAKMTIPSGATTVVAQAFAVDGCARSSLVATHTFVVDKVVPKIFWTPPTAITQALSAISGTTVDPYPAGALVKSVEVQLDSTTSAWMNASGLGLPSLLLGGEQPWRWTWGAKPEDGMQHQLRVRATDQAGNTSITAWQSTVVDVVAPWIDVTTWQSSVVLPGGASGGEAAPAQAASDDTPFVVLMPFVHGGGAAEPGSVSVLAGPVLAGTVTDGSGVQGVRILIYDPLGGASTVQATMAGENWTYTPDLAGWAPGLYALRVQAEDIYGNQSMVGPYQLEVRPAPSAIQVTKTTSGTGCAATSFQVCISGGSIGATPLCKTLAGNGSTATWADLQPGSNYVVTEVDTAAWGEPAPQTVTVVTGQTTQVTVNNTCLVQTGPTFTVSSTEGGNDQLCTTEHCTLREAVQAANNDGQASTIELAAGATYALSAVDNSPTSPTGLPKITSEIVINGHGARIARGQGTTALFRALWVAAGYSLTLKQVAISGFSSQGSAGAILNEGTLTIVGCTLSENTSPADGGAIGNWGTLTVANSTFHNNSTSNIGGVIVNAKTLTVLSSTLAGNRCGNSAGAGAIHTGASGATTLKNTLLLKGLSGANCVGPLPAAGSVGNLADDSSCGASATVSTAALIGLGALADNGGPTQTMAPAKASVAVDKGNTTACQNALLNGRDQRGYGRFYDGNGDRVAVCDVGAFEYGSSAMPPAAPESDAPRVRVVLNPAAPDGANGWYRSVVTPTVQASDVSPVVEVRCALDPETAPTIYDELPDENCVFTGATTLITDGAHILYAAAMDIHGNKSTVAASAGFQIDATAPVISCPDPGPLLLASGEHVVGPAEVDASISGLDDAASNVLTGAVTTEAIGPRVLTFSAFDLAGNTGVQECRYDVIYDFGGFYPPIEPPPAFNDATAAAAVSVKFSLAGDQGLDILAEGFPTVQQVDCETGAQMGEPTAAKSAGQSGLSYDPETGWYNYVWRTDKGWRGTCRLLTIQLIDGTAHQTYFRFR